MGMKKIGGSGLKPSVAAAIVACIWIYNVAFNIPSFIWADVGIHKRFGVLRCGANSNPVYVLAARIINFFVPLIITWTSYIGIIYKLKRSANKVILLYLYSSQYQALC